MRFRVVAIFLLPALFYRALMPVGFMPMVGEGGALEIGLCPGVQDAVSVIFPAAVRTHHHHGQGGTVPAHGEHPTACPYAASGTPALAPAAIVAVAFSAAMEQGNSAPVTTGFVPAILRTQSPRGPPSLV